MVEKSQQEEIKEEFKVSGEELVAKVKEIIKAGNARRIIIKNENNESIIEFPVTVGIIGAALLPFWAALGAAAALLTRCTIVVVKNK